MNLTRRRLLLIEDDEGGAQNLVDILRCFKVDTVHTFKQAKEALFSQMGWRYSAIILDLVLPDNGGTHLASVLKEKWGDIPIIVITGMSPAEASDVAIYKAGARQIFRKPLDTEELRRGLIDAIGHSEAEALVGPLKEDVAEVRSFVDKATESAIKANPALADSVRPGSSSDPRKKKG